MHIASDHARQIIDHMAREIPNECCGIVAGTGRRSSHVYAITNSARKPDRYLMDAQEQLDAMLDAERNGWDLLAFYHSHPSTAPYPSQMDVKMALQSGWLDVYYVLASLENADAPELRAFSIEQSGDIVERPLAIGPSG